MKKKFKLTVTFPRYAWQCLVAMAAEDLREPRDFLNWLVYVEAKRRGMLNTRQTESSNEIEETQAIDSDPALT